jgi:hypothetical protein
MGLNTHIHLGVYIRIPYKTVEVTETKRACSNTGCRKSHPVLSNHLLRNNAKFCDVCGHPITEVDVKSNKRVGFWGSKLHEEYEDAFSVVDGDRLGNDKSPSRGFEYLLPNTSGASLYPRLDENDSGIFPYEPDERQADLSKFGDEYYKLWKLLIEEWPEAKILTGLIMYQR